MGLTAPLFASIARSRGRLRRPQPAAGTVPLGALRRPQDAACSQQATENIYDRIKINLAAHLGGRKRRKRCFQMIRWERCFKNINTDVTWSHFPLFIQSLHCKQQSIHFTNRLILLWHACLENRCLLSSSCNEGDDLLLVLRPGYLCVQLERYQVKISIHPELQENVLIRRRMIFPGVSNDYILSSFSPLSKSGTIKVLSTSRILLISQVTTTLYQNSNWEATFWNTCNRHMIQ